MKRSMKGLLKGLVCLAILAAMAVGLSGCAAKSASVAAGTVNPADIIEIKEKMFIAQTNDIYANSNDYLGKTIRYEGVFDQADGVVAGKDVTYSMVIRYGPGCCGADGNVGFEVAWDQPYPSVNDWVEATGVLEEYDEEGATYLRLRLSSLSVMPVRGQDTVQQ
ncbi:hypothetical protein FACS1894184_17210 [Clostridia bacterium]|nr:hypothetical protein FACS1894184_17210 [Clostridia bacterium]